MHCNLHIIFNPSYCEDFVKFYFFTNVVVTLVFCTCIWIYFNNRCFWNIIHFTCVLVSLLYEVAKTMASGISSVSSNSGPPLSVTHLGVFQNVCSWYILWIISECNHLSQLLCAIFFWVVTAFSVCLSILTCLYLYPLSFHY